MCCLTADPVVESDTQNAIYLAFAKFKLIVHLKCETCQAT